MTTGTARGIRNNNPGNIEINPNNDWIGKTSKPVNGQETLDTRFETFESPIYGIRALARLLITYKDKHSIDTIEGIITKWAPAHENNTKAYIDSVSNRTGIPSTSPIKVFDYGVMSALVDAIIIHENGYNPYSKAQMDKAIALAGVVPEDGAVIVRCDKTQAGRNNLNRFAIGTTGLGGLAQTTREITTISNDLDQILGFGVVAVLIVALGVLLYNYHAEIKEFFKSKFDL